ncbi:hypothetical protein IEQ34_007521 [Dendrobium chrysotoxum]|uniref:Uncharacterized protein n=1 Tax=Dendrobium chrysotoxum TaxID=161865 RepID=A0AAV7H4F5_DENCH|nr:hypothetical protein IEQ34_007521 [Dendrobium chrysotoxum]
MAINLSRFEICFYRLNEFFLFFVCKKNSKMIEILKVLFYISLKEVVDTIIRVFRQYLFEQLYTLRKEYRGNILILLGDITPLYFYSFMILMKMSLLIFSFMSG